MRKRFIVLVLSAAMAVSNLSGFGTAVYAEAVEEGYPQENLKVSDENPDDISENGNSDNISGNGNLDDVSGNENPDDV